jgi:hypothetical protein
MRDWVVVDPFCASSSDGWLVRSFDSQALAEAWLKKKVAKDDGGYAGCLVLPKVEALRDFGPG